MALYIIHIQISIICKYLSSLLISLMSSIKSIISNNISECSLNYLYIYKNSQICYLNHMHPIFLLLNIFCKLNSPISHFTIYIFIFRTFKIKFESCTFFNYLSFPSFISITLKSILPNFI